MAIFIGEQNLSNEVRQLRVAVAQDALDQWRAKQFGLITGIYLNGTFYDDVDLDSNTGLREILPQLKTCDVCMKGACLLSLARVDDKIPARKFVKKHRNGVTELWGFGVAGEDELERIFDPVTHNFLEAFFENWEDDVARFINNTRDEDDVDEQLADLVAITLEENYPTAEDRFEAVLQNLIDNDGVIEVESLMGPLPVSNS